MPADESQLLTTASNRHDGRNSRRPSGQCFRIAMFLLVLTYGILQSIGIKNTNIYFHQQEEQQLLQGFSSPKVTPIKNLADDKKDSDIEQQFSQQHQQSQSENGSSGITKNDSSKIGEITFFHKDETASNKQCWLSSIADLLGCGYDGHAFNANMLCHHQKKNNDTTTTMSHHNVVFKASFMWSKNKRNDEIDRYVSDDEEDLKEWAEWYEILLGNTSSSSSINMEQYFHLPFGTVSVPHELLWEASAAALDLGDTCKTGNILESKTTKKAKQLKTSLPPVLGTVMDHAGMQPLEPKKIKTIEDQRRIVQDLVCIYQHMYTRNFLHRDIWHKHIHYDGTHVSLIDFGRVEILQPTKEQEEDIMTSYNLKAQKAQVFQLMTLIRHVCNKKVHKFPHPNSVLSSKRLVDTEMEVHRFATNWTNALKKCEFVNEPNPIPFLFGRNVSTAKIYEVLDRWTGGCSS